MNDGSQHDTSLVADAQSTVGLHGESGASPEISKTLHQMEQLRLLAESIPQLVWSCRPDGRCEYLSRQWEEFTGIPAAAQLGFEWLPLVLHPDDQERTYAAWMAAVADRAAYDLDYRIRRHDGEYRWFRARGSPVRRSDGTIERWFGTCTDIDDQVRATLERELLLARERESRRIAELLNQVGPRLLSERDPQRLAQSITDLCTELIEAEFGALFLKTSGQDKPPLTPYALSPRERIELGTALLWSHDELFGPVLRDRVTARIGCLGFPAEGLSVSSCLVAPVLSRSGEVQGALIFGHGSEDKFSLTHEQIVTGIAAQAAIALDNARLFADAQHTEEALRHTNDELRRVNEDLNQFAYTASHDLQEPLRMVAIYSQILHRRYRGKLDAEADEYLAFSIEGAQRMQMLVRDLLAYTQVLADPDEQGGDVEAAEALHDAWANLGTAVEESGAELQSGPLPTLAVKQVHLVQLLQNLIGNAIKYRGSDRLLISVSAERAGTMWQLCVHDNGIGIDSKYKDQIFGIFKRLHGAGKYSGTGIGLAICQKIVQRYGGRIWVESEGAGRGSTFCFTLPGTGSEDRGAV